MPLRQVNGLIHVMHIIMVYLLNRHLLLSQLNDKNRCRFLITIARFFMEIIYKWTSVLVKKLQSGYSTIGILMIYSGSFLVIFAALLILYLTGCLFNFLATNLASKLS
ncbi:hypothetical protein SAMN03159341_105322 [Paenibacillus sp. 1_12]|nr:hypothetical protein SAMN03159341_105322 [Paenibacillus sp. 1_12]